MKVKSKSLQPTCNVFVDNNNYCLKYNILLKVDIKLYLKYVNLTVRRVNLNILKFMLPYAMD